MNYTINSTKAYHMGQLNTLGWELTVCNALYPAQTPLRRILSRSSSYGHLLYDYLSNFIPVKNIKSILEIGGGYGYLMKDFLGRDSSLQPCMIDISPFLLQKQIETLSGYNVSFRSEDYLETEPSLLKEFDLAILNENLGDFPTLINLEQDIFRLSSSKIVDPHLRNAINLFERYGFSKPEGETFNLNIGAIQAVEKLCASEIPYIYLGEHSCEAEAPEALRAFIHEKSTGNPERISLKGHDEYTIKFSHLEQVAHSFNYKTIRGLFADFIRVDFTDQLRLTLASRGLYSDEAEMICHFVEDLYKYEYMILIKT